MATPSGAVAIGTLRVGDQVLAYDSASGTVQAEPVQHVFVNHDDNLLDVTLARDASARSPQPTSGASKQHDAAVAAHGSQAPPSLSAPVSSSPAAETIHTTTEHPFLTDDRGFVAAHLLRPGEHVRTLDGGLSTVVRVTSVAGLAVRYNLTVASEHTFAAGDSQVIVHNCDGGVKTDRDLYRRGNTTSSKIDDVRLPDSERNPDVFPDANGKIRPNEGGMSTFEHQGSGKTWWKLPAGTELPDGLQLTNDHGEHWLIEPAREMLVNDFRDLLGQITGWERQ